MELAEHVVQIELGGKKYSMRFSANTMCAYESERHKFFMDVVSNLYDTVFPKGHEKDGKPVPVKVTGLDIVKKVSMEDLRALLWSSIHEYDAQDNPVWPLTINQVGKKLNFQNIVPLFVKFLTGVSENAPTKEELGESSASASATPPPDPSAPPTAPAGGEAGIVLPADALA